MTRRHLAFALAAGTARSGAAAGLMAVPDPYAQLPQLSARHPWADYLALGNAPTGSALQVFAVSAVIYTACLLAAGLLARRCARTARPSEIPGPDYEDRSPRQ